MADTDPESKTEEPTGRRLEQARGDGDVAKSMDLPQWASLAAVAGVVLLSGGWLAGNLMASLEPFIAHPDAFVLQNDGAIEVARMAMVAALPVFAIVMASAAAAGVFANVVQTGFLWAPDKIKPDISKLSLFKGFSRIFGVDSWIQFGKSFLKALVIGVICWQTLKPHVAELNQLVGFEPARMLPVMMDVLRALFLSVLGALGVGAIGDWVLQRQRFMHRMRMSREEIKEEHRQSEGDPHIKQKLKVIRLERAKKRMMASVPKATVVVMNPTHFAVALRYGDDTPAPLCVAKGVDSLALKIRAVAEQAGVPVIEDPPLARALYAAVEVDQTIPRQHYEAVAKVIGFVMSAARKRRAKHR
ncbi:MAG TPA: flagellar biosynthesis protein FlhB [Caulobacteraceae bacterium]|jgi:flagellar biosynthetic protein FlhB